MKLTIPIILITALFNCFNNQTEVHVNKNHKMIIKGELYGFDDGDTILLSLGDGNVSRMRDTVIVKSNEFHVELEIPYTPIRVILSTTDIFGRKMLWVGEEDILIRGEKKSFKKAEVIGSIYQTEDEKFYLDFKNSKNKKQKEDIIFLYPKAPSALKEIYKLKDSISNSKLKRFYKILEKELKSHDFGIKLKNYLLLDNPKEIEIGDEIYDFTAFDKQGNEFILSENLDKKYILLEYRSAYCFPSLKNIPEINNLIKNHGDSIQVVTFSIDTRPSSWKDIQEDDSRSIKIWDGKGEIGKPSIKYGITGSPFLFIISPEGIVIDKWFGYSKGLIEKKWREVQMKY